MICDHQILHFPPQNIYKGQILHAPFHAYLTCCCLEHQEEDSKEERQDPHGREMPRGSQPWEKRKQGREEEESPRPWVTQHLQRDRTEDHGQPIREEMLLGAGWRSLLTSLLPAAAAL